VPSVSKKQHNLMAAVAHNPAFAKKVGIPQSVGMDFNKADKGKKFKEGGTMKSDMKEDKKMDKAQDKAMLQKAFKQHDMQEHKGGKGTKLSLKKGGKACMADGGEVGHGLGGLRSGVEAMIAAGRKNKSSVDELQDMLPSKQSIGRAVRSKLDPELIKTAMNPVGYAAEKAYDRLKDTTAPRSYSSEKDSMKKGGTVKKMASGGKAAQLSKANGIAQRGKTRGKIC